MVYGCPAVFFSWRLGGSINPFHKPERTTAKAPRAPSRQGSRLQDQAIEVPIKDTHRVCVGVRRRSVPPGRGSTCCEGLTDGQPSRVCRGTRAGCRPGLPGGMVYGYPAVSSSCSLPSLQSPPPAVSPGVSALDGRHGGRALRRCAAPTATARPPCPRAPVCSMGVPWFDVPWFDGGSSAGRCTDYHALRLDIWRRAHPGAVREYRITGRCDSIERRQFRRAERRRLCSSSCR